MANIVSKETQQWVSLLERIAVYGLYTVGCAITVMGMALAVLDFYYFW